MKKLLTTNLGMSAAFLLSGFVLAAPMVDAAPTTHMTRPVLVAQHQLVQHIRGTVLAVAATSLTVRTGRGTTEVLYPNAERYRKGQLITAAGAFRNPATFDAQRIVILAQPTSKDREDTRSTSPEFKTPSTLIATIVTVAPKYLIVQTGNGLVHLPYANGVHYKVGERIRATGGYQKPGQFYPERIFILSGGTSSDRDDTRSTSPEYKTPSTLTATIVAVAPKFLTVQTGHGFTHVLYANGVHYKVGEHIRATGGFRNPATYYAERIYIVR